MKSKRESSQYALQDFILTINYQIKSTHDPSPPSPKPEKCFVTHSLSNKFKQIKLFLTTYRPSIELLRAIKFFIIVIL